MCATSGNTERRALFLDRDGVINRDSGHVYRIEDFAWVEGIFDTVRTAKSLGFFVIVVTNQAGIAKGLYTEADYHRLTKWMLDRFEAENASLTDVYFCPEHPSNTNRSFSCRKPAPGMLFRASQDHQINLHRSVLIGDQETDIEAGRAAGLNQTALFASGTPRATRADVILNDHSDACRWLTLRCSDQWNTF